MTRAKPLYIVSGLPRSGTSLLMQMAAAAGKEILQDGQRVPDPSNPHGYFECERVKTLMIDSSWLHAEAGKVVKIVLPLLPFLPRGLACRIAIVKRDLDEVIASQTAMLQRQGLEATANPDRLRADYIRLAEQVMGNLAQRSELTIEEFDHAKLLARQEVEVTRFLRLLETNETNKSFLVKCIDSSLYRSQKGQ